MENRQGLQRSGGPLRPTPKSTSRNSAFTSVAGIPPSLSSKGTVAQPAATSQHSPVGPSQAKRARKERGPNWGPQEVLALIEAKRDMHLEELDSSDGRELMTPESTKWQRISQHVTAAGNSPCVRDGAACKTKWNQLLPDYKKIADFSSRTGRDIMDYWQLTSTDRKVEGLPPQFGKDFFHAINDWFGNRPLIQPPHIRDLLSPSDANFHGSQHGNEENMEEVESEPDPEDVMDVFRNQTLDSSNDSSGRRSPFIQSSLSPPRGTPPPRGFGHPLSVSYTGLPPGVIPQVLSSSENTAAAVQRRPNNTAVRRKNLSGHSIIAEATKSTGAAMASQMKGIADASLEVEKSKMDVQLRLFTEQMAYQRERDMRLHESACTANDNARLAIQKQGDMVTCLSQLTYVLGKSMTPATAGAVHNVEEFNTDCFTTGSPVLPEQATFVTPATTPSAPSAGRSKLHNENNEGHEQEDN